MKYAVIGVGIRDRQENRAVIMVMLSGRSAADQRGYTLVQVSPGWDTLKKMAPLGKQKHTLGCEWLVIGRVRASIKSCKVGLFLLSSAI